ncbi:hypothetical protein K0M31_009150 [Melipona bicolor]|uniref:Uncharacterized protein n=1 Tax=Melipona bicolor TaxID=60889 RepID=A0AA40FP08_9HYME|nr:hypothetical protein K0M31_009150 [Melipona bicolor]
MKSADAKTTTEEGEKRRRVAAVQTNTNRANDARANIDVCVRKHKPADVIRGGADAFSNTFEHGDTYEGGQVEYGLGDSLSNSLRGLSSRVERNFEGRDRFADVKGSRRPADMNRQIIKYPRYVVGWRRIVAKILLACSET